MSSLVLLLYLTIVLLFVGGLIAVVYHFFAFRLNKSLASTMSVVMLVGGVILLLINMFYFLQVDWGIILENGLIL